MRPRRSAPPAVRLLAALAVLAGLLGSALLPAGGGAALRGAPVAAPSGSVVLPGSTSPRTLVAAARAAVARAASGTRAAVAPAPGPAVPTGPGLDLAVLPAAPVVAPPVLLAARPRPPTAALPPALAAGPTGRSPPAAAAP